MAGFLASQELQHHKFDNQPRDLLWGDYLRRSAIAVPTHQGLAFDTAIASAQYAMTSGGVMLGDVGMFALVETAATPSGERSTAMSRIPLAVPALAASY